MSKFVVLTDSTCDLPDELAKQHDIDILCFKIALDGEGYTERVDFTPEQFCQMLMQCRCWFEFGSAEDHLKYRAGNAGYSDVRLQEVFRAVSEPVPGRDRNRA